MTSRSDLAPGPPGGRCRRDARRARGARSSSADIVNLHETADDAPVIKLVNQIVAQAVELGASDVHLAPDGKEVRVRLRVDGVLQDITTVPRRMAAGVVSRVKIMAELDISERRLPQDGRVSLTVDGRHVDLRVVTLPSVHGESIVMRILDKDSVVMKLEKLGMADAERERFEEAFHQTHGAVLVTGPTGSGKSTTLYAALQALNTPEKNIITVEDPVEYQIEGITQVQVSTKAGLTFATGLRAMVRADPDVIMVGEIRDRETAQIAIESALTGHLVLSTLHTNDAPSAITRLIEMGIEPFLVASALDCVLAQRLARMLCANCKQRTIVPAEVLRDNGYKALVDLEAYEPVGCRRCGGTRLPRARRDLRGDDRHARDPQARARTPSLGGDPRRRRPRGHAPPARRRPGEGPPRPHVDRRDRPRDRQHRMMPTRRSAPATRTRACPVASAVGAFGDGPSARPHVCARGGLRASFHPARSAHSNLCPLRRDTALGQLTRRRCAQR